MTTNGTLELCVLLPEAIDACDACVDRLSGLVGEARGVTRSHVMAEPGRPPTLCLHYDPEVTTLAQIERLACAAGAELEAQYGHAVLPLRAIGAEDAARRIESGLLAVEGVLNASANLAAQRARVEFDARRTGVGAIEAALARMGYASAPAAPERPGWLAENRELVWSLAAGGFLIVGWAGERWLGLPQPIAFGLYVAAYVAGGWDLASHLISAGRQGRFTFDIDLLMLVAAAGAAALGEWAEGAFLLFLFSLAHALEHFALDRARGAIRALAELAPPMARVLVDGREVETPVEQVAVGDVAVVRPGERIPVDGTVRTGRSAVNQAPITGESVPVEKGPGNEVFAGTVNGEGALEVTATRAAGDRTLDRVVAMVEEAQTQKAPTQRFSDRFERIFVPAVLIADVLLIVVPPMAGWWSWSTSFYRGMALLAAASPCALALGTPSAVLAGIAQAARHGVLIKGGMHLENLGEVRAIALDKTGTLTEGRPAVTDLAPAPGVDQGELLRIAAAVEGRSQHPLAQAVARRAQEAGAELPEAGDLESLTGRGVRSTVEGQMVEIGNARLWEERGETLPDAVREGLDGLQAAGRSTMIVRHGARWLGVIGLADQPRPGVGAILDALRARGVRSLIMLTGDHRRVGEALGREVGVDHVEADLLPQDKVTAIRGLLAQHGKVAMVGDGVNDAPALAHATVGIAMGGAGTAAALETADVALMADDLGKLPFAIGLSHQARAVIRQNMVFSLAVVALLLVATVTGFFGIGWAVLVHEGSTLIVIANALRLMAYRPQAV
ncbi:putative cadmium-transporting ATPase [compost metagenome]